MQQAGMQQAGTQQAGTQQAGTQQRVGRRQHAGMQRRPDAKRLPERQYWLPRLSLTALVPAVLVAMLFSHADALAQGCAMCGTVVNGSKDPLAKGLAYSIVLMLAIPNVLVASIGGWLVYVYRRAAFRTEAAGVHEESTEPDSGQ